MNAFILWIDWCIEICGISGWVNTLIGGQHHGGKGFMFFAVDVDLTEEGIGKVISTLFCPNFI